MLSEPRLYETIGENIRRYREQLPQGKMTQGALADAIGMERTSISNIEKGTQKVSVVALYQIAAALRVSVADLLPGEEIRPVAAPSIAIGSIAAVVKAQLKQYPLAERATEQVLNKGL